MKYFPVTQTQLEKQQLDSELKNGRQIGKVIFGQEVLLFKRFMKTFYIPYTEIYRAFRRVQCIKTRMCCANTELQIENLVICDKKQELYQIDLPDTRAAEAVIALLMEKQPEIKIGVKK